MSRAGANGEPVESLRLMARIRGGVAEYVMTVKAFSRNARLYLIGSFLMAVNYHVFQLLLNLYLKEMGFHESQIGQVLSSRAIGQALCAIPAALILCRVRLKPLLFASCLAVAGFSFLLTAQEALLLLCSFSLLVGMAYTFYQVAAAPFYMRNSTPRERTHLFSFSFGMMLLAGMAGSLGSGRLVTFLGDATGDVLAGYRYTLYLGITVGLLALIPFLLIDASRSSRSEDRITISRIQLRKRGRFYFRITFANFLVGLGAGLIIPFLNLYFKDRFDLKPDAIGAFYFLVHLSMFAGILAGPVLARKFGLVRAVVVTQLASIPFMLILAYTFYLPLAVVAFIIRGGLMNLGAPIVTNFGMELSHKGEQGLVNALLMVSWSSAWMASAAAGGVLIERFGYTVTMNITVVLYVISSLTFYGFFKDSEVRTGGVPDWIITREGIS
jgi:predicted MFS family arabinose efflux permease